MAPDDTLTDLTAYFWAAADLSWVNRRAADNGPVFPLEPIPGCGVTAMMVADKDRGSLRGCLGHFGVDVLDASGVEDQLIRPRSRFRSLRAGLAQVK